MIKTCGFRAIEKFISGEVWLSIKSVVCILNDAGFKVCAFRVNEPIQMPLIDIGYKDDHYYNISESDVRPSVVFLMMDEWVAYKDKVRILTAEECERMKGGKGSVQVTQPTPPPQPTTGESMADWVKYAPEVFAQQQEFAPQEAQQQLELLQEYATPTAQAYKDAQDTLYPETTALQEQMSGIASRGMNQGLSDAERDQYRSDFSANLGTNAGSPMGADYMSRNMMMAQQGRQDYYNNMGLSLAGRQPLAQPTMPAATNYMAGFTPQSVMNFNQQGYGAFAQAGRPIATPINSAVSMGSLGTWG